MQALSVLRRITGLAALVLVTGIIWAAFASAPASAATLRQSAGLGHAMTLHRDTAATTSTSSTPTSSTSTSSTPTSSTSNSATTATVGLLGPSDDQLRALIGTKVTRVVLPIGWNLVEPQRNVYDNDLLAQAKSKIDAVRNAGFQVVLDLGLQYPPSWVFSLPGATRFVNQYGDVWQGSLSEDVPNAVFNPAVRSAEEDYINTLSTKLGSTTFASVRIGGLLSGELRYPPNTFNGHQDSLWDYDAAAQASAPVRGWKPGTGSASDIRASLAYYFDSLTNYETWMMKTVNTAFPRVDQQVMLPGWGVRPGMVDDAVATGMTNQTIGEVNGMIASGLDWANQVKAISTAGVNGTVYTTWLDAPTQAATVQGEAPVDYLASLATQYKLPIAGENAGGGGTDALALCVQRVRADHLTSFMYMAGGLIDNGSAGISLTDLTGAASSLAG